jgi:hypothetical protein
MKGAIKALYKEGGIPRFYQVREGCHLICACPSF